MVSKQLCTKYLLSTQRKENLPFMGKKEGRHHLSQVLQLTSPVTGHVKITT